MAIKSKYRVVVKHGQGEEIRQVIAATPASACRQVFRILIRDGIIKNTPKSELGGTWQGVSVSAV